MAVDSTTGQRRGNARASNARMELATARFPTESATRSNLLCNSRRVVDREGIIGVDGVGDECEAQATEHKNRYSREDMLGSSQAVNGLGILLYFGMSIENSQ